MSPENLNTYINLQVMLSGGNIHTTATGDLPSFNVFEGSYLIEYVLPKLMDFCLVLVNILFL